MKHVDAWDAQKVFLLTGRDTEAELDLDEAIRLDPKFADAYFMRGELNRVNRKWEQALADYMQASELGCRRPALLDSRACVNRELGRLEAAFEDALAATRSMRDTPLMQ